MTYKFLLALAAVFLFLNQASAASFPVTVFTDTAPTAQGSATGAGDGPGSVGDLRSQIIAANAFGGPGNTITFTCNAAPCTITLGGPLPPITSNLTIDGGLFGNIIFDGNSAYRVFLADTGTIVLRNLQIQNALAQGGAGGDGKGPGGGGAGFGAGLFVNQAAAIVTVQNTYFLNCSSIGGKGGNANNALGAGGGGSMGGFAGGTTTIANTGAGGAGMTGPGFAGSGLNGGAGGPGGGGGGGAATSGTGGIGGSAYATNGAGLAGAQTSNQLASGNGGFGAGGGGDGVYTYFFNTANGGFGGGGGGDKSGSGGQAGFTVFGGGAGAAVGEDSTNESYVTVGGIAGGYGGYGGGGFNNPTAGGAGGGAAAGPAIFVNAGSVTIVNSTGLTFAATGGLSGSGAHLGGTGGADATPVFNFGGSVNSSSTVGPIAGALPGGLPGPSFTMAFGAPSVLLNGSTSLTFTLENPTVASVSGLAFTDSLPAGLLVSTPNGLSASCGGTTTGVAGSGSVTLSGVTLSASSNCTISVNVTGVTGGLQTNTASALTWTAGGPGAAASASITVGKLGQTITFGALPVHTYGDAALTPSATATSGQTVTFSITSGPCSVLLNTLTITGAGSCVIAADQAGNASYNAAPTVSQTLTVNQAVLTVTANSVTEAAGFAIPTFTAGYSGFINPDTATVLTGAPSLSTTATQSSPAGSYPITVTAGTLTATNYSFTFVNGTYTLTSPGPSFAVNPTALIVQYVPGLTPTSITETLSVTPGIAFTASSSAAWLVAPAGTTTGAYPITLNVAGLAVGNYQATVSLQAATVSVQVLVFLTVNPAPVLASQPTGVGFLASYGSTTTTSADLQLTSGTVSLPFTVASTEPWLTVSASSASTPATLHVQVNPTGLPAATLQASIVVTVPGAANSPFSIPVQIIVSGTGPGQSGISNSASFGPAVVAPNTILSVFGSFAGCTPAPQVLVNGTAAQILFSNATQINLAVPGVVAAGAVANTATIQTICNGVTVETVTIPLTTVNPAIFTQSATGSGSGSILNQDESVNSAANAAARGGYISVYVTGFGAFNAASPDGLQRLTYPVTATIGGVAANVVYAGEAPGETSGLQQVNIQVPASAPVGPSVPIVLTVNGVSTQSGVTVAIQ